MAYFVSNASEIAFNRIKMAFFIERFAKICLSKNISLNIKMFVPDDLQVFNIDLDWSDSLNTAYLSFFIPRNGLYI
jgi:hypothetical protein